MDKGFTEEVRVELVRLVDDVARLVVVVVFLVVEVVFFVVDEGLASFAGRAETATGDHFGSIGPENRAITRWRFVPGIGTLYSCATPLVNFAFDHFNAPFCTVNLKFIGSRFALTANG